VRRNKFPKSKIPKVKFPPDTRTDQEKLSAAIEHGVMVYSQCGEMMLDLQKITLEYLDKYQEI
jgi:hypothetical protein